MKLNLTPLRSRIPLLVIFLIGLFLFITWANYQYITGPKRYVNHDFMSLWAGGRAVLEGVNPYDPEVWGPLRTRYGSKWIPDSREPFPLWTILFFLPFSTINVGWSSAAWLTASLFMLGFALYLLGTAFGGRKLSLVEFAILAFGAALYRGGLLTLQTGQITYELLLISSLFLFLSRRKRPFAAGLVLALVTFKPNPFILFLPLVLVWLLARRRWTTLWGAVTGGVLLLIISWITIPGWLWQWLNVRGKTDLTFITPTTWGLAYELTPDWWVVTGLLMLVVITAVLGHLLVTNQKLNEWDVVSLAITASILTTPYAWEYEHLQLLIPWAFIFFTARRYHSWVAILIWIAFVGALPWVMFEVALRRASATLTAVIPLATLFATYLTIRFSHATTYKFSYANSRSDAGTEASAN